jgi:hypothetical protein
MGDYDTRHQKEKIDGKIGMARQYKPYAAEVSEYHRHSADAAKPFQREEGPLMIVIKARIA